MLSILAGLVFTGAGGASLWYFKSQNGKVNELALKPILDFTIPIAIISLLAVGVALIFEGIAG
jgi:hypothetical protein